MANIKKYLIYTSLSALIALLGFGAVKQVKRTYDLNKEMGELKGEIEEIEVKNEELRAQIESFQDPATIDKEARKRLNLKKEGEEVVIIIPPEKENIEETPLIPQQTESQSFWDIVKSWFE